VPVTPEALVEDYLSRMVDIRGTGGATNETSYYGALETLLNAVGKTLKPRVICNGQLRSQGAGHPDFGLDAQTHCRSGMPREGQGEIPERGVVEVKGLAEPVLAIADTDQVSRYWRRYRLVLVTNYREFLLVGVDARGLPVRLETFTLADTDAAFWEASSHLSGRPSGYALINRISPACNSIINRDLGTKRKQVPGCNTREQVELSATPSRPEHWICLMEAHSTSLATFPANFDLEGSRPRKVGCGVRRRNQPKQLPGAL
jgi:hypothetical protein